MVLNPFSVASEDEVSTPHQTTLLRLIDSYLQILKGPIPHVLYQELIPFLITEFFALSVFAQAAISKSLGLSTTAQLTQQSDSSTEPLQELDLLLPKACEALVLILQCLISTCLHLEQEGELTDQRDQLLGYIRQAQSSDGLGVVESDIGKLGSAS
jgi:ataxin-10